MSQLQPEQGKVTQGKKPKRLQHVPRLHTPLVKGKSRANEVIELAERINMPLMEWQKWVLEDMLKVDDQGNFKRRTCGLLVARQPRMVKHT